MIFFSVVNASQKSVEYKTFRRITKVVGLGGNINPHLDNSPTLLFYEWIKELGLSCVFLPRLPRDF